MSTETQTEAATAAVGTAGLLAQPINGPVNGSMTPTPTPTITNDNEKETYRESSISKDEKSISHVEPTQGRISTPNSTQQQKQRHSFISNPFHKRKHAQDKHLGGDLAIDVKSSHSSQTNEKEKIAGNGNGKDNGNGEPKLASHLVDQPQPVGFFEMFRFTTKFEGFLNVIGLFAAICAGAAQVRIVSSFFLFYFYLQFLSEN